MLTKNIEFFLQVDNLFDTKRHYGIYVDTGLADESTELQRYLDAGTVPGGLNSLEEWYIDQSRMSSPRSVKIGLSYKF